MVQLITTSDQSHTLYLEEMDETYHSRNGAIEEALYVYIKQGLKHLETNLKTIRIFEVGFGTGLNAWLTFIEKQPETKVEYYSIENNPITPELANALNYAKLYKPNDATLFQNIHQYPWGIRHVFDDGSLLAKFKADLHHFTLIDNIDLIYFDAFGPDKQPDIWSKQVFEKLHHMLKPGGILVTYSAKGSIRRMLAEIGFLVERLPGPPKKRHMLRAQKKVLDY